MTDANGGRPLTRRELRELERAAELAHTGGMTAVPSDASRADAGSAPSVADRPISVGRHSSPSAPSTSADATPADAPPATTQPVDVQDEPAARDEDAAQDEPKPQEDAPALVEPAAGPLSRLFGRRKAEPQEPAPVVIAETASMDRVDADDLDHVDVVEAEIAPDDLDASVPAPSSARRSRAQVDDVQGLDRVDEADLDSVEIDEVQVEQPRVSALRIAQSTPAELADGRDADQRRSGDDVSHAGPSRGRSERLPVIVNVVSDTSEHHIADLREAGVAGGSGSSTSSITANALVLPAGTDNPEFQLEGDDGLLVTGSIDVPEGFASSGRGSASIDGNELDTDVAEGEVQSPETAPVRASRAVSSYANARVQIAPQKQRSNPWPIAIGVGAGVFVAGVVTVLGVALTQGWL